MVQDNIVTIKSYHIDQDRIGKYEYAVYHKDDNKQKKPLYLGTILEDGTPVNCTCTGFSLLQKCYHGSKAHEITEVPILGH